MRVEALAPGHHRVKFRCGDAELDRYFRGQAGRDTVRRLAAVFVLVLPEGRVAGYYTLAPATVFLPDLLGSAARKGSRYPAMPAAKLSRLGVDTRQKGRGYGRYLLADALARVVTQAPDSMAVIAKAETEAGRAFYTREGFLAFPDRADCLFRPVADLRALLPA